MTLFTTSRPTISVKSLTRYPTRITTGTGLSYTYDNGTLNISLDYSDIPDSAAIADPANYTTVVYNKTTGALEEVQLDYIPTTVVTDPVYTRGDSNFTIPNDYRVLSLVANLTASRTWTLPSAEDVTSGNRIFIYDTAGGISAAYPLVIAAPSGDTINGASSITLSNAFAGITIVSNGGTQWTAILTNVDSVGGLGTNVANALKSAVNSANGVIRLDGSGNVPALNGAALTSLNASNLVSGTVPAARLPGPSLSTIGGVKAKAAETSKFVNQIDTDGSVNLAQPAFSDISGSVAASQLPNPSASTLGGVQSKAAVSNQFLTQIGTDGSVSSAQPTVSNISGFGTGVATFLATPSSANLASAVTDETGTGALVFANSPALVTPALGTPASGNLANCTFPTLNQNTTGTAAGLSATLGVSSGGTGLTSLTAGYIPYGNGTGAFGVSNIWSDGTNVGIGTNSPTSTAGFIPRLQVTSSSATGIVITGGGTSQQSVVASNGSGLYLDCAGNASGASNNIIFRTASGNSSYGAEERLRITSAGDVGIGTTSPTEKLVVQGPVVCRGGLGSLQSSAGALDYSGNDLRIRVFGATAGTGAIAFRTGGGAFSADTETMRLDASGNLGLGVTPSAWSLSGVLQISRCSLFADTGSFGLQHNAYFNSGWKYIASSQGALQFQAIPGTGFLWQTAPSGTAGNAISFTQAMTLDASGNFYVGTTSQSGGSNITFYQPANADMKIAAGASTATRAAYQVFVNTTVSTVGTENSSGGSLAIGTAAYSTVLANSGAYPISFATANTERARIDSSGNLLVGTTSVGILNTSSATIQTGIINAAQPSSGNTVVASMIAMNSSTYTSNVLDVECARNTTNSSYNLIAAACQGVAYRFYVRDSGNVVNTNNSYGAISDIKLKENIVDATPKLDDLLKVKIRTFNWKEDQLHKQIGVVAQELEEVFPSMIEETVDRDKDGVDLGTTTKSVKYSVFTPIIIKALQELAAKVSALEAKQ